MSTAVTLYGISNCDTIRKARAWLGEHAIDYAFHDYRKQGIDLDLLESMATQLGWEQLLNRRGTTWRALPDDAKADVDEASALRLMCDNPALVKRPVLSNHGRMHLGFSDGQYQEIFESS